MDREDPNSAPPGTGPAERLWRLRRLHQQIDARLLDQGDAGVDLQFVHNGAVIYTRRWETREGAVGEAAEKRTELERGGWAAHW